VAAIILFDYKAKDSKNIEQKEIYLKTKTHIKG